VRLKQFLAKVNRTYGEKEVDGKPCVPDWVRALVEEAWTGGRQGEFHRLRKKILDLRIECHGHRDGMGFVVQEVEKRVFGKDEKKTGQCEYPWCQKKATWDVCATDGRSVLRCGRHKADKGLTVNMRRVEKPKKR
jgi:hypothetical protein